MSDTLITLTTDFGLKSPYVAAMKGVILSTNRAVRLLDLSHDIPPQNVRHAAFFLAAAPAALSAGDASRRRRRSRRRHGAGDSVRRIGGAASAGAGRRLLDAGDGSIAGAARDAQRDEPGVLARMVSRTFHGRDVFAPAAGDLSLGLDPHELGPMVSDWQRLHMPGVEIGIGESAAKSCSWMISAI